MKLLTHKEIAFLGISTALIASLRPIGFGSIGIEPMWFALIIASRVLGPYIGLLLGALSMFFSALLTAGIGPWLPWQMAIASCIGFLTIVIPKRVTGRSEIFSLLLYAIFAAEFYGFMMDLVFWPIALGSHTQLSFDSSITLHENAMRFFAYHFVGALAWDVPRAIFTASLILLTGKPILAALTRALKDPVITGRVIQS